MPDTPDFDQIALRIVHDVNVEISIVEQLRLVWNARGAADTQAVERRIRDLVAGEIVGAGIGRHVADAIGQLDR